MTNEETLSVALARAWVSPFCRQSPASPKPEREEGGRKGRGIPLPYQLPMVFIKAKCNC